jgi:diaminobutyrate acetyltransferase
MKVRIRKACEEDFLAVYRFVSSCPPLEKYFEHFYKIMLRYFRNTCFIAEEGDVIIGFLMGFISPVHENTYFLWQVGVSPATQGKGVGKLLLKAMDSCVKKMGGKRIEVTVDPENEPSLRLFKSSGYVNISRQEGETVHVLENLAVKNYYSPGRHFILFEKLIRKDNSET